MNHEFIVLSDKNGANETVKVVSSKFIITIGRHHSINHNQLVTVDIGSKYQSTKTEEEFEYISMWNGSDCGRESNESFQIHIFRQVIMEYGLIS